MCEYLCLHVGVEHWTWMQFSWSRHFAKQSSRGQREGGNMHLNNERMLWWPGPMWARIVPICIAAPTNTSSESILYDHGRCTSSIYAYIQFPDNFNSCKFKANQKTCTTSSFIFFYAMTLSAHRPICVAEKNIQNEKWNAVCLLGAGKTNACTMQTHNTRKWITEKIFE